jgi:sulfur carrier protein ThiS
MDPEAETDGLPSIEKITRTAKGQCVYLKETATVHDLLADLADGKRKFTRLEEARMPIEDIFVEVVGKPVDSVVETGAAS